MTGPPARTLADAIQVNETVLPRIHPEQSLPAHSTGRQELTSAVPIQHSEMAHQPIPLELWPRARMIGLQEMT